MAKNIFMPKILYETFVYDKKLILHETFFTPKIFFNGKNISTPRTFGKPFYAKTFYFSELTPGPVGVNKLFLAFFGVKELALKITLPKLLGKG